MTRFKLSFKYEYHFYCYYYSRSSSRIIHQSNPQQGSSLTSRASQSGINCHQLDSNDVRVVLSFQPTEKLLRKHRLVRVSGIFFKTAIRALASLWSTSAATPSCHCCKGTVWRAATCDKHPKGLWWRQRIHRVKLMWKSFECYWYVDYVYSHQLWIGDIWAELLQSPNWSWKKKRENP